MSNHQIEPTPSTIDQILAVLGAPPETGPARVLAAPASLGSRDDVHVVDPMKTSQKVCLFQSYLALNLTCRQDPRFVNSALPDRATKKKSTPAAQPPDESSDDQTGSSETEGDESMNEDDILQTMCHSRGREFPSMTQVPLAKQNN